MGKNPSIHIDGRGFVGKGSIAFLWGRGKLGKGALQGKKLDSFPRWSRIVLYLGYSYAFRGEEKL